MKNKEKDELREFRIESLKKLIPELIDKREKNAGKRFLITFIVIYLLVFFFLLRYETFRSNILWLFLFPLIIYFLLMIISYIISSFTFCKNQHEAMVIEKLKTELATLTEKSEDFDWSIEISKIRNFL